MSSKEQAQSQNKTTAKQQFSRPEVQKLDPAERQIHPAAILQRVKGNPRTLRPGEVLQLQRTIGNQAVGRLLRGTGPSALQRHPEEEEEIQMKPDRLPVGPEGGKVPPEVESAINRARGGGQPLERTVQEHMSETLGHDFSGVRVHTDAESDTLNQQLSAKAFTTGRDMFFKQDEYNPGTSSGRKLIAHELSHVVQQNAGRVNGSGGGMTVQPAGERFEREADNTADIVSQQHSEGKIAFQRLPEAEATLLDQCSDHSYQWNDETGGRVENSASKPICKSVVIQRRDVQIQDETYTIVGQINHTNIDIIRKPRTIISWFPRERWLWHDNPQTQVKIESDELNRLNLLFNGLHALNVTDLDGLLRTMMKHAQMIHPISIQLDRLRQIRRNLQDEVRKRVDNDITELKQRNMLPDGETELQSIKLTGSDVHKGGRAVAILNFKTPVGDRKLIYKPGDLGIDEMIYGSQKTQMYADHNLKLPTYHLWTKQEYNIAAGEAGITGAYGYEEFVEERGPQTIDDLLSIYKSLADNMAVGYVMGYRDIHKENFIIKQQELQMIDIEAMTGHYESLENQGWAVIMNELVKRIKEAGAQDLQGHTITADTIQNTVRGRFVETVNRLRQGSGAAEALPSASTIGQRMARFVPIPTAEFQNLIARWQGKLISDDQLTRYNQRIREMMDEQEYQGVYKWRTEDQKRDLITLLQHPDTRRDIHDGNVPFYVRRLDSNNIYSSRGNLVVTNMHHVNIDTATTPIAAIEARRGPRGHLGGQLTQLNKVISLLVQAHNSYFPGPA